MSFAEADSLANQMLIATPTLSDGIFKSSVTYICEHNKDGAMGIIINRPSDLTLKDILDDINFMDNVGFDAEPVMVGGPVGLERGFVLHQTTPSSIVYDKHLPAADSSSDDASGSPDGRQYTQGEWMSTLQVTDDVALTGSKDILLALGEGKGPKNFLMVLGYAGWSAGQLEQELMDNAWLTLPATPEILFSTPYHLRAAAAAKLLGVDLSALATRAGNA